MEYAKIIAISGMPGLFEMLGNKGDGAIVRSLEDKSSKFVSARVHHFTHLESIEVYTERENVNLVEILNAMENTKVSLPDEKDNKALANYFKEVYPQLDFTRVYVSDMKKMVKWFASLKNNNIEIKLTEPEEESVPEPAEIIEPEEKQQEAPKKAKQKKETKVEAKEEPKKSAKKSAKPAKATKSEKEEKQAKTGAAKKSAAKKKSGK